MRNPKNLITACLFLCLCAVASAQDGPSLEQIRSTVQDPHVSASAIDALLPRLLAMEKNVIVSRDSQQLALDIFLQASYAYARNFHFKQGLLVYQGYLNMKDRFALMDKTKSVNDLLAQHQKQQATLDSEISAKQNSTEMLTQDIDSWKKINGKFSRNYSLIVILVTAVLALVFIRINMNTVKAKNNLKENRDKMVEMQRVATLGRFYAGDIAFLRSSVQKLQSESEALAKLLKDQIADAPNELTSSVPVLMKQVGQTQRELATLLD